MSIDWRDLIPRVAHDVRALVRKGLVNAELLERLLGPGADAQASAHLRATIESQTDLNRFVIRLVALAEAERVHGPAPEETVELETAVLGAKLECRDTIQRAGAELSVKPLPACSVPHRTQIVLKELIDNSLRYGDPARSVRVVLEADFNEERVRISVADNGAGVAPAYTGKLFQPLQRLDAVRSGFGLGLAIARAIVDGAGGTIYTEPAECGARFIFELPNKGCDA